MKFLIFVVWILFFQYAHSENTEILNCHVSNKDWQSAFIIDSLGIGVLKFQKTGDKNFYVCTMKMRSFNDTRGGMAPSLRADMRIGNCDPSLALNEKHILNTPNIIVDFQEKDSKAASLQWLKDKAPESCKLEKFKLEDMHDYVVKWQQGLWGVKTPGSAEKIQKKF